MNKLNVLKIALLIVILAEEIKRAKEFKYLQLDRDKFKEEYHTLVKSTI
ncbi:hypothetical protein [Macrococcoides caseolyticum]|nr:hypothetical protein [Macrococcus caseolyticus]